MRQHPAEGDCRVPDYAVDLCLIDAGAVQSASELADKLGEPVVQGSGLDAEQTGDAGHRLILLEAKSKQQAVARRELRDTFLECSVDSRRHRVLFRKIESGIGYPAARRHPRELFLAREASPDSSRELDEDSEQRFTRLGDTVIDLHRVNCFIEGEPVAADQLFKEDGGAAETAGSSRGSPFAPALVEEIEAQPLDDNREIRPDGAASLELPENGEILVDQLESDDARELLRIRDGELMTARHGVHDAVDMREVLNKKRLEFHRSRDPNAQLGTTPSARSRPATKLEVDYRSWIAHRASDRYRFACNLAPRPTDCGSRCAQFQNQSS